MLALVGEMGPASLATGHLTAPMAFALVEQVVATLSLLELAVAAALFVELAHVSKRYSIGGLIWGRRVVQAACELLELLP